jgi:hypothetical protein
MKASSQLFSLSKLHDAISSDSCSSGRSTIPTQPTFSCSSFDRHCNRVDEKHTYRTNHHTHAEHLLPLRPRTSSDISWFSVSDDEDDSECDDDLLPAIHKTINSCSLYYHDDDITSATACSSSSSITGSPTDGGIIRQHFSFGELLLLHDKFIDLSSPTSTATSTTSVKSSRTVQFSEDPPRVFSYDRPEPQYKFLLYYDEDEMNVMMSDYMNERRS